MSLADINAMFSQLEEDTSARAKTCYMLQGQARFDKANEEYKQAFASKEELQRIFACEWSEFESDCSRPCTLHQVC